ncbi:MAG: ABC transporter ATP-binding protein [Sulfuritalea sp.]|nr:ABC transporter ATP-binding protein [Sulfuritalea sp.]
MAAISIQSVSKSFGTTPVLHGVSLDIADGEFVTLLGPSGCGKSTLLRLIAGLESADEGSITIGDTDVTNLPPKSRDVAMVFQSYALYPHLSVFDNIAVPLRMRRLSSLQRLPLIGALSCGRRAAEEAIAIDVLRVAETLGITALLQRKPGQLSGGQRQRVAVGRAMVREPEAFLMDEPLSNLDAKLRVHMRTEFTQLHRSLATTFVYVTHDQAEAMTMSTRVAVMLGGRVLQVAPPEEIYHQPADLRVAEFVGSPRINLLRGWVEEDHVRLVRGNHREGGMRASETGVLPLAVEAAIGSEVRIAFRPEGASLTDPERTPLRGAITNVENLGSDWLVHVTCEASDEPLIVRVSPGTQKAAVGHTVGILIPPGMPLLAFSADGPRLRAAPARAMPQRAVA